MKNRFFRKKYFAISVLLIFFCGCRNIPSVREVSEEFPDIFPLYINITIPCNIAPLNFKINQSKESVAILESKDSKVVVYGKDIIDIPYRKWKSILDKAKGGQILVTVYSMDDKDVWKRYKSFSWNVSRDNIDPYITYRLIEPTYANWNEMGIYQRDMTSFDEKEVLSNKKTNNNCINCHAFNNGNPDNMVLHLRKINPGTLLVKDGNVVKLNTKTQYTISNFVYPNWHPKGDDIAFSTNNTQMSFYEANHKTIEVYDLLSDIIVYNIKNNEVYTSPLLSDTTQLENFPVFSPDGNKLYFCSCPVVDSLPQSFEKIKYKLCSIDFDVNSRKFGNKVDTVIDLTMQNRGISLPSISPNGRYLICSVAESGCFLSWDKASDLYIYDTQNKILQKASTLNSEHSESYTNWSSNSKWIVFSSRRLDGVHNRPFVAHIDDSGNISTPFVLPQKNPDYYKFLYKAYNLPQLTKKAISLSPHQLAETAVNEPMINVDFRKDENLTTKFSSHQNSSEIN